MGPMATVCIFVAAVTEATEAVPRELTALCSIILPIAVIENCKAIGIPTETSLLALCASNLSSSCSNLSIS